MALPVILTANMLTGNSEAAIKGGETRSLNGVASGAAGETGVTKHSGSNKRELKYGRTTAKLNFSEQDNSYEKKSEPFTVVVEGKDGRHVKLVFPGFKVTMSTTGPEVRAALEESLGSMGLKVVQGGKESKSSTRLEIKIDTLSYGQVGQEQGYQTSTKRATADRAKTVATDIVFDEVIDTAGAVGGSRVARAAGQILNIPRGRNNTKEYNDAQNNNRQQIMVVIAQRKNVNLGFYGLSQGDQKTSIEIHTQISKSKEDGNYYITKVMARNPGSPNFHYVENVYVPVSDFNPDRQFIEAYTNQKLFEHIAELFPRQFEQMCKANGIEGFGQQQKVEAKQPQRMDSSRPNTNNREKLPQTHPKSQQRQRPRY